MLGSSLACLLSLLLNPSDALAQTYSPVPRVFHAIGLNGNTVTLNVPPGQTFFLRRLVINVPSWNPGPNYAWYSDQRQQKNELRAAISLNNTVLHSFFLDFVSRNLYRNGTYWGASASESMTSSDPSKDVELNFDGPVTLSFSITAGYTGSVAGYLGEPYDPSGWGQVATTPAPSPTAAPTPVPTATPTPDPSTAPTADPSAAPPGAADPTASDTVLGFDAESATTLASGFNRLMDAVLLVSALGFIARIWWRVSRGSI